MQEDKENTDWTDETDGEQENREESSLQGSPVGKLIMGVRYSLFAVGQLLDPAGETIEPLLLTDSGRAVATEAQLRVLHAAPTAPAVDVYLTTGSDISSATPVLKAVPFKADSGYLAVAAGDYQVTVTASGDKSPVIGPLPVTLANGQVLTAAALSDSVGGVDPELLILDDVSSK